MERIGIEQLRQKLEFLRQEILQSLSRHEHETPSLDVDSSQDSANRCLTSLSKESLFERTSKRRTLLRLIESALRRIVDCSFGVCVACGDDIQGRRLEALPWTQFCLRCQEAIEEEVGASLSARTRRPIVATWRRAA